MGIVIHFQNFRYGYIYIYVLIMASPQKLIQKLWDCQKFQKLNILYKNFSQKQLCNLKFLLHEQLQVYTIISKKH